MTRDEQSAPSSRSDLVALINEYVDAASKNGEALEGSDSKQANTQARQIARIRKALDRKDERVRTSLMKLLNHPNPWVRSVAAFDCLEFAEQKAVKVLQEIAQHPGLVGVGAEWYLRRRQQGRTGW